MQHLFKITNITPLFIEDMIIDGQFQHVLWYRSNDTYDVDIVNKNTQKIIETSFVSKGFPEYIKIAAAIIDYIKQTNLSNSEFNDLDISEDLDSSEDFNDDICIQYSLLYIIIING